MKISAIFCESTYGNFDSKDSRFNPCFQKNLINALDEGKTVLLPAFAQGRYQEILYVCKMMQKKEILSERIKIYADGYTGQEYTRRYTYDELEIKKIMKNFIPKNLCMIPHKTRREERKKIFDSYQPKIIIAPSGMLSYGSISSYVTKYISKDDALIHMLGYCAEGSKGYELQKTLQNESILYNGLSLTKRCDVKKTGEFSAHAKRDELLAFLQDFNNLQSIIINHGEENVKEEFANYLREHFPDSTKIGIINSQIAFRIETDGVEKTFSTHSIFK